MNRQITDLISGNLTKSDLESVSSNKKNLDGSIKFICSPHKTILDSTNNFLDETKCSKIEKNIFSTEDILSKSESVKIYWLSVKFDWFK